MVEVEEVMVVAAEVMVVVAVVAVVGEVEAEVMVETIPHVNSFNAGKLQDSEKLPLKMETCTH